MRARAANPRDINASPNKENQVRGEEDGSRRLADIADVRERRLRYVRATPN